MTGAAEQVRGRRGFRRRLGSALIAACAATAALTGSAAILGPAPAAALVNQRDCGADLSYFDWLQCQLEKVGGGTGGPQAGGGSGNSGAGPTDTPEGDSEIGGPDGTYGTGTFSSQPAWDKLVSKHKDDVEALALIADDQVRRRGSECNRLASQERKIRDEIGDDVRAGGSMSVRQRKRLSVVRIGWRYYECDELWSSGD